MVIEVSHESPVSMLECSLTYNDYAYALVHLFETHPDYFKFYKKLTDEGNVAVLLDNSIFELGKSFDPKKYVKWIDKLKPNWYIVPDVLESASDTIQKWKDWDMGVRDSTDALRIGVVQGKTWDELVNCYQFMVDHADIIAISFDYSYYNTTGRIDQGCAEDKLQLWSSGRQRFINQLIDEGYWNWRKSHHLLGCSLATEFRYYVDNDISNIRSVDTSNPIVSAIKGYRYNDDQGLICKPTTKLADLIDAELDADQIEDVMYNTSMFKKILRR